MTDNNDGHVEVIMMIIRLMTMTTVTCHIVLMVMKTMMKAMS